MRDHMNRQIHDFHIFNLTSRKNYLSYTEESGHPVYFMTIPTNTEYKQISRKQIASSKTFETKMLQGVAKTYRKHNIFLFPIKHPVFLIFLTYISLLIIYWFVIH